LESLDEHFTGLATWTHPTGGLFVWMEMHDHTIDAFAALSRAIEEQGVAFVPGGAFSVTGGYKHTIRLNFSAVEPESIREGIARLKTVLSE